MGGLVAFRATAAGLGAIGVVVVAGEGALSLASNLFKPKTKDALTSEGRLFYGHIVDGEEVVDEALWLFYEKHPRWGCEAVEFQTHGGVAVVERLFEALVKRGVKRVSFEEFMEVAVGRGWMSRLQAESEAAAVDCRCLASAKVVGAALDGRLERRLKDAVSLLDGGDLDGAAEVLKSLVASADAGVAAASPRSFFILGPPNVGKSTLFNRLVGAERMTVSEFAGTTVDVVEGVFEVGEFLLRLFDAAGVEKGETKSERIALRFADEADFLLFLIDGSTNLSDEQRRLIRDLEPERTLIVINKSDLPVRVKDVDGLFVSALTGDGLDELRVEMLRMACGGGGLRLPTLFTRRQILCAEKALDALESSDVDGARSALLELIWGRCAEQNAGGCGCCWVRETAHFPYECDKGWRNR